MLAVICTVKHSANRPLRILSPLRFSHWFLFCDIKVNSTVLSWYFSLNFTLILSLPVREKVSSLLGSVDHGCKLSGFVKHSYLLPINFCLCGCNPIHSYSALLWYFSILFSSAAVLLPVCETRLLLSPFLRGCQCLCDTHSPAPPPSQESGQYWRHEFSLLPSATQTIIKFHLSFFMKQKLIERAY